MPNKIRNWTKAELEDYNLLNCSPRPLPGREVVAVRCNKCPNVGQIKFSVLISKKITSNLQWRCNRCLLQENSERGKKLTGDKNPFYKKTHTKETREYIGLKNKEKWLKISPEELKETMAYVRKCSYEKYVGNPMSNKDVRKKHQQQIKAYFLDKQRVLERSEKTKATNLLRYNNEFFLHSDFAPDTKYTSKAELEILTLIKSFNIDCTKRRKDNVEIDVFIPSHNLGIEMNGCYFHSEKFHDKKYHLIKTEYAENNNIKLLQIWDHEWHNRKTQIMNFVKSSLRINTIRYFARKCEIKIISKEEGMNFIDEHHIQGSCVSKFYIGLFNGTELLSVGAFGLHHRNNKQWTMKRFVTKGDVTVVGGLSKISKFASNIIKEDIISWCDRRWSNGNGYIKSGWIPTHVLSPDYFYIKHGRYFCSKQSRRKQAIQTPKKMTEHEHAKLDGLLRVFDCGKIRFIYKYKID